MRLVVAVGLACLLCPAGASAQRVVRTLDPVVGAASSNQVNVLACTADAAYAFGRGVGARWDGATWVSVTTPARWDWPRSLTALADGTLYVAGPTWVHRRARGTWTTQTVEGRGRLEGLSPLGATRVMGYGRGSVFLRDGTTFRAYDGGTWRTVRGMWANTVDDVWTVADGGTVQRWNGRRWRSARFREPVALRGVVGRAPRDVWVWGVEGAVWRWNGRRWLDASAGLDVGTVSAVLTDGREVYAAGFRGVARRDGNAWTTVLSPELAGEPGAYWSLSACATATEWIVVDRTGSAWAWPRAAGR